MHRAGLNMLVHRLMIQCPDFLAIGAEHIVLAASEVGVHLLIFCVAEKMGHDRRLLYSARRPTADLDLLVLLSEKML